MHYKFYRPLLFSSGYFSTFVSICFDFTVQVKSLWLISGMTDFFSPLTDYILLANFQLENLLNTWHTY